MYLRRTSCIICTETIPKVNYNLKTTKTEESKVLLIKLVEKYYSNINLMHCNICSACFELLNELDTVQRREKELLAQLKSYISKIEDITNSSSNSESTESKVKETPNLNICDEIGDFCLKDDSKSIDDNITIPEMDLIKGLPIKVKRVVPKSDGADDLSETSKPKSKLPKTTKYVEKLISSKISENQKAFEQIQSSIQMDLTKHVAEHGSKLKPKNVLCEICGINFKSLSVYEKHQKKHDNEEDMMKILALNKMDDKFVCPFCQKKLNNRASLTRHMIIHSGKRRFQCDECGKNFLHDSSFRLHKKIHAGIRNYLCELCNHRFLTRSHLKRHQKAQHEKKDRLCHVCEICGKKFSQNYNLLVHIRTVHSKSETSESENKDDMIILVSPANEEASAEQCQEEGNSEGIYYEIQGTMVKSDCLIQYDGQPVRADTVFYTM